MSTALSLTPRSNRAEALVLPSIPPSPTLLEEMAQFTNGAWSEVKGLDEFELTGSRLSPGSARSHGTRKGKGKGGLEDEEEGEEEDDDETVDGDHHIRSREAYPPMTDETAETRRVEETLKRWELAERQRRKSLRDSGQYSVTTGPSLIASVTRTASLVLASRNPSQRTSTFKSHDTVDVAKEGYAVPIDEMNPAPSVAVHSPSASIYEQRRSTSTLTSTPTPTSVPAPEPPSENPFVHPDEGHTPSPSRSSSPTPQPSISPFADSSTQATRISIGQKSTHASKPSASKLPPPRPLGLPSPSTDGIPRTLNQPQTTPLRPTPQPVLSSPPREDPEEQRVRWWHEWLCGCGEGPDRGGENQAGRTNPFE